VNPLLSQLLPDDHLQQIRLLFPHISTGLIYLNHAAVSPLCSRVLDTIVNHLQERSSGKIETWPDDSSQIDETKRCVQRLINAESYERIALVGNTSEALNIIAAGLDWKPGDRILLNDLEFPANVYPYYHLKSLGVEIDIIHCPDGRVTSEAIYAALRPRTRLLALSAVQFLSGYRADLAVLGEICRSRGILFIVDGIQAAGAMSLDVQEMRIDALAAGAAKWQMGPHGIGFLYLTEELQARIHQKYLGWLAVETPWNFFNYDQPLATSARRFEGGTINIAGMWGYYAALTMLLEFGVDRIQGHILALTQALIDQFQTIDGLKIYTPTSIHERAGIVTIQPPEGVDPSAAFDSLLNRRIIISLREGKLRYSTHFYNSVEEVKAATEATREVFQQAALKREGAITDIRP
jgi:cysteine desulfurase/selenocysteine lyase